MKTLLTFCLMLTCATLHAQSVIVKGTGAGSVHRAGTGAGSVRGVATPVPPRFAIQANTNVVLDNDSGLMWTRDANLLGHSTNWYAATNYCETLDYAGYDDWRLPNIEEASRDGEYGTTDGLVYAEGTTTNHPALPAGHPFVNIQNVYSTWYWATLVSAGPNSVSLYDGTTSPLGKTENSLYVWPCRGP